MVLPAVYVDVISCAKCGGTIGRMVDVEDEELIQVGGLIVTEIHGNCAQCGEEFHYSLNQRRLERLLLKRRNT